MSKKYALGLSLFLVFARAGLYAGTKEEIVRLQSDMLAMQNRVLELQKSSDAHARDIKTLLQQLNETLTKTNTALTAMRDQADIKLLMENILRETKILGEKLDDTNSRISTLAQQVSASKVQVEEATKDRTPGGPLASPSGIFNTALNDFNRGNYDLALQGFQNYLSNYRSTELAGDAQYYAGESLYNLRRFDEAVLAFNQVINVYPKSSRVLAAYLKKGLALMELSQKAEAIEQFNLLIRRYPGTQEANIAKQKLELLRSSGDRLNPRSRIAARRRRP